ncbi:MAG: I78 family peptidase inhibitor [Qingshengfaniella sp.]
MRLAPLVLIGSTIGLIACGPPRNLRDDEVTGAIAMANATCDASLYTDLVGQDISVVDTLDTGLNVRVLGPDAFVTRDYDANRLTFTTTPSSKVGRVFCG